MILTTPSPLRVIAAVTDDPHALAVVEVARRLGDTRPLAVHVEATPPLAGAVAIAGAPLPVRAPLLPKQTEELEGLRAAGRRVVERLDLGEVECAGLVGDPAMCLAELAAEHDALAIVTGHRGRGGLRSVLLGSVSRELARIAPCPVIVTDGSRDEHDGPVLAGLPEEPEDAACVEGHARRLAAALDRPLLLLEADGSGPPAGDAGAAPEAAGDAAWRMAAPGRPAEALREAARHTDAALVVVGSRTGDLGALAQTSTSLELARTLLQPLAVVPLRTLEPDGRVAG